MKQTRPSRVISAKDYQGIDREVRQLVRLINKVDGVATLDSCFGHTGDKRGHTNQMYTYIGVHLGDHKKFMDFFAFLLKHTYGGYGMVFLNRDLKWKKLNTGFSIGLHSLLYPSEGKMSYQLLIHPMNQAKARREKLAGVAFLERLIRQYLKLGPEKAKAKVFGLKESLEMIRRYGQNPGVTLQHMWSPTRQASVKRKRKRP